MKVIDLINMMNNEEDLPEKMIINKSNFHSNVFKDMIYEEDCNTDIWMAIKLQHIDLDDTVTVIEDNTIDIDSIEELTERMKFNYDVYKYTDNEINNNFYQITELVNKYIDKQNEILRAVKHLNKEIQSIKK